MCLLSSLTCELQHALLSQSCGVLQHAVELACSWLGLMKVQEGPEPSRGSVLALSTRLQS